MTDDNVTLQLQSGKVAIRAANSDGPMYHVQRGWLTLADVEALYADAISGNGGRELPEPVTWPVTCRRCGQRGHCATMDSIDPDQPSGNNCRRAAGRQSGAVSPPARRAHTCRRCGYPLDGQRCREAH